MVEKGIMSELCHSVNRYAKAICNNKYYNKNEEPSCLKYWNVNYFYG